MSDAISLESLEERAIAVSELLRVHLLALVRDAAGSSARPGRLCRRLSIDKSLASRIVRSLFAETPYELLHRIPSPTGLGLFLATAEKAGCNPDLCAHAVDAIREFQDFLEEIPGGRPSLDAIFSESVLEVRQRTERSAAQSVFRAMSHLLGFRCETISSALILQPSADGRMVDGIDLSHRVGIRRLRPSAPVALFSLDLKVDAARETTPHLVALHGNAITEPLSLILPDFCEPSPPAIELYQTERRTIVALAGSGNSLQAPATITSGVILRNGWTTDRRQGGEHESGRTWLLHYPCRLLVRDLYIHDDLYVGCQPHVRLEFPDPSGPARPRTPDYPERLNTLDMAAPVESLGRGLRRAATSGIPQHAPLVRAAFERAGWDPERFRGYRARIEYPVPMITMGWWIPLPEAPGASDR